MGQIQSGIGLISGIPITDIVDKLMQTAGKSRNLLKANTEERKTEQAADTELAALLLAVKYITHNLGQDTVYNKFDATSSNSNALVASVTGDAIAGSYQFTPLRTVQSQQWLSSSFPSASDPIGSGTVTFRFGSAVQRAMRLEQLNGGTGFARGSVRITDRSGASATIDLSAAQTLDDVLDAINGNSVVNVTATAQGDHIHLVDNTGLSVSNLKVQEVGGGSTAASLGLAGINDADGVADGQNIVRLSANLSLNALNDGNGVRTDPVFDDIQYTLRGGTTGTIDLSPIKPNSSDVLWERTLGDIVERFNAANSDLKLEIAPDGKRLIATDLSTPIGGGTFTLTALHDSGALADLGLDGAATGGTIQGRRVIGGARTVLLSSLNGGQGLGTLGSITLTDRGGGTVRTVNLSGAVTLDDVIDTINGAGSGITARVNQARNGIELIDTTGSSGTMTVADVADGTQTASTKLHIAVNDNVTSVNSGDLHLQVVAENTRLADFNGGAGVARGTFTIHDTAGHSGTVNLGQSTIQTIGDAIRAINRLSLGVRAEINTTGDGIRLVDTAQGSATLSVSEGTSTTAHDLHLDRAATEAEVDSQTTKVIDGTTTYTVTIGADDTLDELRDAINNSGAGVSAMRLVESAGQSYRLGLTSQRPGLAGELVIDTSGASFSLQETVAGQDALLLFGAGGSAAASLLMSSSSNKFQDVVPGVDLTIKQASTQPVTVTVQVSDTNVVANVKTLVDNFNKFRTRLNELTAYDSATDVRSALTGDIIALRLDVDMSNLISGRFGSGSIQSLRQIGITLSDDGTLGLDESKLQEAYADDPEGVKSLFTDEEAGVSAQFDNVIKQLAGEGDSLLTSRINGLKDLIQWNQDRIDAMNAQLNQQRQNLLTQFYNMELAIARMQSSLSAISAIQPLNLIAFSNNSNS